MKAIIELRKDDDKMICRAPLSDMNGDIVPVAKAYEQGRKDILDEIQEILCEEMENHSVSARPVGWSAEADILTLDNVVDIIFEVFERYK